MKRKNAAIEPSKPRSLARAQVLSTPHPAINISESLTPSAHFVPFRLLWQLPNPLGSFSGRKLQLSRLDKAFQNKQQHLLIHRPKEITSTKRTRKTPQIITCSGGSVKGYEHG
jgi:hypothetical protein